ncbi:hypothetical protein BC940DRAFT_268419 [Gongronella butleri]|nr:hypothetical protein BC940DRAFT_268419 [Gongronella butleri]
MRHGCGEARMMCCKIRAEFVGIKQGDFHCTVYKGHTANAPCKRKKKGLVIRFLLHLLHIYILFIFFLRFRSIGLSC